MTNCPKCGGSGFIYEQSLLDGGRYCECMLVTLKLSNMELIWRSLSKAHTAPGKSKLLKYIHQNLWITTPLPTLRSHLKALCLDMPSHWDARVRSDADILDAWFGTAKAEGVKIFDLEVSESSVKAIDITDLISAPSLVILVLGIKRLPNRETPNAVLEALSIRQHDNMPTWLVDQPEHPILSTNHKAYSESLEAMLNEWTHISLEEKGRSPSVKAQKEKAAIMVETASEVAVKSLLDTLNTASDKPKGGRRK